MSKLYNNSGILGCKSPQKSGNSPQTVGKMVLPAQECENLENPTCSTQLATPFAAPAPCAAIEKLDNAAVEQSAAGGKFGNGVELGSIERRYVAGDETGSTLSGHSTKTQQILANTHKCFVQKANNNTNAACRTAKKHSKVLRAVACGCLAMLMCGTAFLGTACSGGTPANVGLNGSGSAAAVGAGGTAPAGVNYGNGTTGNAGLSAGAEQNFATQSGGLITPRADDPVLFETKDGLQIKFGAGLPSNTNIGELTGGELGALWVGRPYFQTTGTDNAVYTWVIVGVGNDVDKQPFLWRNLSNVTTAMRNEYKNNIFDVTSPAGAAIVSSVPANMYDANIVVNSEITNGYVLVVANQGLGTSQRSNAATDTVLPAYMNNLYTSTGLSALGLTVKSHNLDGNYPNLFPPGFGEYAFPYERYGISNFGGWSWKSSGWDDYYLWYYIYDTHFVLSSYYWGNITVIACLECKLW